MLGLAEIPLLLGETILSPWLVLPVATLTMLFIGAHVLATQVAAMPAYRKRLRIVNGLVMMFVAAALAYALGIAPAVVDARANPVQARAFVAVWLVIIGLLGVVVAIAVMDAVGTAGSGVRNRLASQREFREKLAADAAARARAERAGSGDGPRG